MPHKKQRLTTLQHVFDDTAWHLFIQATIAANTFLLKMTLSLIFCLYSQDNLGMGIHQL